ncbi:hypothetical protein [Streptomyces sp. NPDC015345]|uniref:hypothetical protein n=1 Tax=Streptomyces sp. NPDC015345 TaxID=3364953 RepID=UPI0036FEDB0F
MIQTQAAEPPPLASETVSRPSLMADLANAQDRNTRLVEENRLLRERLSAALGEEIWREAAWVAPPSMSINYSDTSPTWSRRRSDYAEN